MHRWLALASITLAIGSLSAGAAMAREAPAGVTPAGEALPVCARAVTTTLAEPSGSPAPAAGSPCWVQETYPFVAGAEEGEVRTAREPSKEPCEVALQKEESCYPTVTSMVFKAFNEGRAVTSSGPGRPKMVWRYENERWTPDGAFQAQSANCTGDKIISAGTGDYWLIDATPNLPGEAWRPLCRFDRESGEWSPQPIPKSTAERLSYIRSFTSNGVLHEELKTRNGAIRAGACFAWNDCWFFGSYGVTLHWSEVNEGGEPVLALREAPTPSAPGLLPGGEFLAAASSVGPAGDFGLAVGANGEGATPPGGEGTPGPLQINAGGEPPAELYSSIGGAFQPVGFTPPSIPENGDPYATDLTAVGLDAAGQGWVAGRPALESRSGPALPAPLLAVSRLGEATACVAPPAFKYSPPETAAQAPGSFSWSSIAVVPATGEAIAAGQMRRAPEEVLPGDPSEDAVPEPVIAQITCQGRTTLTRFRTDEISAGGTATTTPAPADREGEVTAVAASAPNDAWAATGFGVFASGATAPPHLYHLTDAQPPEAEPAGGGETRTQHPAKVPTYTPEPEPAPAPAPAPKTVTSKRTIKLPAAVYDVHSEVHSTDTAGHVTLSLYISFKLRRAVTIGARALRNGRVVSAARAKHFRGRTGLLILVLDRAHWPTKVTFVP